MYTTVLEVDERVTLIGFTSDPKAKDNAVVFNEDGTVKEGYRGVDWDGKDYSKVIRGMSGEAVRIMQAPGELRPRFDILPLFHGFTHLCIMPR